MVETLLKEGLISARIRDSSLDFTDKKLLDVSPATDLPIKQINNKNR